MTSQQASQAVQDVLHLVGQRRRDSEEAMAQHLAGLQAAIKELEVLEHWLALLPSEYPQLASAHLHTKCETSGPSGPLSEG